MANTYHKLKSPVATTSSSETGGLGASSSETVRSPDFFPWMINFGLRSPYSSNMSLSRFNLQDPDRLFLSVNLRNYNLNNDDMRRTNVKMPPPLPRWLWTLLTTALGIGPESRHRKYKFATLVHAISLLSALVFGIAGFIYNVYDTVSEFTMTTILVTVAKTVLGAYWIALGIYSSFLSIRLFNNAKIVNCMRLHSKTFLKVSSTIIIIVLSIVGVVVNLISNLYLLEETEDNRKTNASKILEANCLTVGIDVNLCKVYFGSKAVYSFLCLTWNLLVAGIFLSVCRTHTISIRRFMAELIYDSKILVEYNKIQNLENLARTSSISKEEIATIQQLAGEGLNNDIVSDTNIWDDDIVEMMEDSHQPSVSASTAQLLQSLRIMRINTSDQLEASTSENQDITYPHRLSGKRSSYASAVPENKEEEKTEMTDSPQKPKKISRVAPSRTKNIDEEIQEEPELSKAQPSKRTSFSPNVDESHEINDDPFSSSIDQDSPELPVLGENPPIMTNDELLFIYFQLVRRMTSTSRIIQRWLANWIGFVLLWCSLMIVHWYIHTAALIDITQFLIPLLVLGLLTSGYAEVNFEGERVLKCIMPTEERMSVIYYFQNTKLELKIYSFTVSYNTMVTLVAGVAVTFATKIILESFGK